VRRFGKYRLLELLASGGMAEVWRAELPGPAGFAKEVALKLVRADLAAQPELSRLFEQEARLASRLGHANVVQVFESPCARTRYPSSTPFSGSAGLPGDRRWAGDVGMGR
jgi:serine/threonine-protein kinase